MFGLMGRFPVVPAFAVIAALAVLIGAWAGSKPLLAGETFKLSGNAEKGKPIFLQYCAACHGEKGDGNGPAGKAIKPKPRDFNDKGLMASMTDEHIYKVIGAGGASVGKSPLMTPWKGTLTDQQIRDVAAFVRTFEK